MPRDDVVAEPHDISLPGFRRARVIAGDDAGRFALLTQSTWIDRLHAAGELAAPERDAAAVLHAAFEQSGIRPHLIGSIYDGAQIDGPVSTGALLETLTGRELKA